MKHIFSIFLLSVSLYSCRDTDTNTGTISSDDDSTRIDRYFEKTNSIEYIDGYDYYMKAVIDNEKIRDTALIHQFMSLGFDSIKKITGFNYQPAELIKYVHTIDLNEDGKLDIVYEGPSGGEPTLTEIYLQDSLNFRKIFTGYQIITKMNFIDGKLVSFNLIDPGCCADPQIVEYHYTVSFNSLNTEIKLASTVGYLSKTELLKNKFRKPIPIITKAKVKLRSEALVFEGIEHPVWGSDGNIIGYYPKGSRGIALGNKKDSTGTWLYVLMNADTKPEKCEFPTFLHQPTGIYGWMKEEKTK